MSAPLGPGWSLSDGVVTIRAQDPEDVEADLEAKDEAQIRWLWLPGEREMWEAKTPAQQREHARRGLIENRKAFGPGPKWNFAVDSKGTRYVAYVDCDLANPNVPEGEANIAYSCHPEHRGRGYVSRAVRLVLRFLAEYTTASRAHLLVDPKNEASLRVARSVARDEPEPAVDELGLSKLRFVVPVGE